MAGFNLFSTNTTTSTTQSASFGVSSTPSTGNTFFGSNTSAFGSTQPSTQNVSFGGLSATGNNQSTGFGASSTTGNISFGLPKTQNNLTFGSTSTPNTTGGLGSAQPNTTFGAPSAQGGISFGTPSQPSVGFGASAGQSTPTNIGFGASTGQSTPTNVGFGASTGQSAATSVGFGTSTGQPASTNVGFGVSTGQASATNVGFGASTGQGTATNVSFGASAGQSTGTNLGFGASTGQPAAANVGFGTSTGQPTTTFGSPGALPSFGSLKPQTPIGGTNLFATSNASSPQTSTLLGNSTPTSNVNVVKPTFGGLSFAANTSAPQTGVSFGLQPSSSASGVSQAASTTTQPNLFTLPTAGTTATAAATSAPTLSFGSSSASQPLSFGTGTTSLTTNVSSAQPTSTQTGLGGLTFSSSTTAPSLSFGGLGATSVPSSSTTTTGLLGSSFGTATSGTGAGIFSWQKPTTEATTTTATSVGLGGLDHTAVSTAASTTNTVVSAKEQMLPNEIQQTVASLKEYVKTQKNLSSEVARTSSEPLTKLTQQIGALHNLILTLGSILSQQKFTAEKIKLETIKSLNDYELAQKIKDSPVASEERMYAVRKYFTEKISAFEEGTKTLQEKIEYVYQHVITLPQENSLSAEALKLIVKKLHDSFVVIGARAYKLHNDMQLLKVQYLTLRNQYVKDNSSIGFSLNREFQLPFSDIRSKNTTEFALEGPNPFSRTSGASFNSLLLTSQHRNFPPTTTPSKDWNVSGFNTSKLFGFSDVTSNTSFDQNSSLNMSANQQFNLQKPPIGNKRGKR